MTVLPPFTPPNALPPDLPAPYRQEPATLDERVLWWVGRARWLHINSLAALCGATSLQMDAALWRLAAAHRLRVSQRRVLLTNGGLRYLADRCGAGAGQLAAWFGWDWAATAWSQAGDDLISDRRLLFGQPPGAHKLAVLDLFGRAAGESQAPDIRFWGVRLEDAWTEREVAARIGRRVPRPDGYLAWRVRRRLQFRYFVELESGSQRPGALVEKLIGYARYAVSAHCRRTWEQLPCVAFICPTLAHETRLAALCARTLSAMAEPISVLLTYEGCLRRRRLLDTIWRAPGETAIADAERTTLWGRDDPALLLLVRQWLEWARPVARYRIRREER